MAAPARPRLGFLGTGWIGRDRMRAVAASGVAEVALLADPSTERLQAAAADVPGVVLASGLDGLLDASLDGIVIATPSALHAEQAIAALEAGLGVFCQKPLARTAAETERVLGAARRADRLLGVDLSYRHTAASAALRERITAIGPVHAVELVFHNAFGPDKPWFRDPVLAGGGCVVDLGIHLVDLLLWMLDFPRVEHVTARRWLGGRPADGGDAEDFCLATLELGGGAVARLACSWFSHEGRDAVIEATFRGRDGALSMHNFNGSFYDFGAELREGTAATQIAAPPDAWGGRAAVEWARRLAAGERYDARGAEQLAVVAATLDRIYGR
ncbi:MAG TPA: Gfo/Idh/MocA family oxidoreductase [Solirubrobacteraceae bacterium]